MASPCTDAEVTASNSPTGQRLRSVAVIVASVTAFAFTSRSPAVGVMLDTFHMNMEESDLARAIRQTGDRLFHFQANENHRGFVGSGHIDWPPIARALVDIGYAGPIVLEPFRRDDEDAGVTLAQWRAPARDEDAELAASIDYLKATMACGALTTIARSPPTPTMASAGMTPGASGIGD